MKMTKSEMFKVQRFVSEHAYTSVLRKKDIGACIKRKYMNHNYNYLPKLIIETISHDYGIEMNYHKVWRCKEKALTYLTGFIEMSY